MTAPVPNHGTGGTVRALPRTPDGTFAVSEPVTPWPVTPWIARLRTILG